jgi:hypothetical protein
LNHHRAPVSVVSDAFCFWTSSSSLFSALYPLRKASDTARARVGAAFATASTTSLTSIFYIVAPRQYIPECILPLFRFIRIYFRPAYVRMYRYIRSKVKNTFVCSICEDISGRDVEITFTFDYWRDALRLELSNLGNKFSQTFRLCQRF